MDFGITFKGDISPKRTVALAKQAEANTLDPEHTAPINDVIAIIKDTAASTACC